MGFAHVLLFCSFLSFSLFGQANEHALSPMQYEDIVNLERPEQVFLSPDGSKVVFITKIADICANRTIERVYMWDSKDNSTKTICELDRIQKITWQGDEFLYILGKNGAEHQILLSNGKESSTIVSSEKFISTFAASGDGNHLYYSQTVSTDESALKRSKEEGYVYRWTRDSSFTIVDKEYGHSECDEILHFDRASATTNLVTSFSYENWIDLPSFTSYRTLIEDLHLSDNGRYAAISLSRKGDPKRGETYFSQDLVVVDLFTGSKHQPRPDSLAIKLSSCWISDRELVFGEWNYHENTFTFWTWNSENDTCSLIDYFPSKEKVQSLTWNRTQGVLVAECRRSLFRIDMEHHTVESIKIPAPLFHNRLCTPALSFDHELRFFSSVQEDSNTPPQVVVYDSKEDKFIFVSSLNPSLKNKALGHVEKITFSKNEEIKVDGFLVHPVQEIPNHRYPLIIATYGFSGQTFIADAEWHSSFPAQTLAAEGYMVLLLNHPKECSQTLVGNHLEAQRQVGWDALAAFEHAVDVLDEKGLIDPSKVGLYGWSHGAFVVEFCISHSQKFHVASIGEGGDNNPGCFWVIGDANITKVFDNTFGGPPWGTSLHSYLDFCPFFQVDKIHSPLLMEFAGGSVSGLEMYVPLRTLNIPAELVVYDGEIHNFEKPKARIASMARKVDWFNYWLLNKRAANKQEQYNRWDMMHSTLNACELQKKSVTQP